MNTTIPPQANINAVAIKTTDNMVRVEKLAPSILTILLSDEKITGEVIAKSQLSNPESNKPQLEKLELANLKLGKLELSKTHIGILTIKTANGEIDIKTKLSIPIGRNIILTMPTQNNIAPPKPPYSLNIQIINNASSNTQQENIIQPNTPKSIITTTVSIKTAIIKNITEGIKFTAIIKVNPIVLPNYNQVTRPQITATTTLPSTQPTIATTTPKTQLTTTTTTPKIQPTTTTTTPKTQPTTTTTTPKTQPTTTTTTPKTQPTTTTTTPKTQPTIAITTTKIQPTTASTDNIKLPNGWSVDLKIIAIQKQGDPSLPKIASSQENLLTGKIINSSINSIEIQTNNTNFIIAIEKAPPVGTMVLLSIENAAKPPLTISQPVTIDEMTQRWDGLRDALTLLGTGDVMAAKNIMQSIPQSGVKISSSLLFFINAIRGDNINGLLGQNNLQSLGRISKTHVNKLTRDFQMTTGRATDTAGNEWRSYNIPMLNDNAISNLQLFIKKYDDKINDEQEKKENKRKKNSKRFIIEVNFTKIGPLQLDGIANNKNIELMIRSYKPLDDNMRDEIKQLFIHMIEPLGLTGMVGFHVSKKFDVKPIREKVKQTRGISV